MTYRRNLEAEEEGDSRGLDLGGVVDMPVDRTDRADLVGLGVPAATAQLGVPRVLYSYSCSRDGTVLGVAVDNMHLRRAQRRFRSPGPE